MRVIFLILISFYFNGALAQSTITTIHRDLDKVKAIEIDGSFLNISVVHGTRTTLEGIIEVAGERETYTFKDRIFNEQFHLSLSSKDHATEQVNEILVSTLSLTLSPNTHLQIKTSSGNVKLEGISQSQVDVRSISGAVEMNDIHTNVNIHCDSGSISGRDLQGSYELTSGRASITIDQLEGTLKAKSDDGDIRISDTKATLDLQTIEGSVDLRKVAGLLSAISESGSIVGKKITLEGDVSLRTASGAITIDFKNDIESLSFFLTSSSGTMEVEKKIYEESLTIDRGGFRINAITKHGDQKYF